MKRYIGILLFLISISCYSQTMSVSSFKLLETDLDANTPGSSEKDQNGETAALIKVVTTQTGFTFDGGSLGIVKTKQTPGEIWVYIPRGAKKITIKHPQLGVLRDYYFTCPIEAARTYEMVLVTGSVQTIVNQDAGGQYLVMSVDPPTAIVYIDDNEVSLQNGSLSKFLSYGNHTYRISDPLFTTDAGSFEIGQEKKELNIKLKPSYGILQISTKPENGARVFMDDDIEPIGSTPFVTKKLKNGLHKFRFQLSGYDSKTITHEVHGDGSTQPLEVALTSNFASVTINASDGCTIYINNENKGVGVWKGRLDEGLYRIEARKPGHASVKETITVEKGEDKIVSLAAPTPIYGGLNITSNPIGATIFIDNEKVGKTPDIINKVLIGTHSVRVEKEGYTSEMKQIDIVEGKIQELSVELNEKKQLANNNSPSTNYTYDNFSTSSVIPAPATSNTNIVKAIMNSRSYNEAVALVHSSLSSLNNSDRAKAYNKLVDLAMIEFEGQSTIQTENALAKQMGKSGKYVNEELMSEMAYNAVLAGIECDKYDQMPDNKGKVSPQFAPKNAKRLWFAPRNQLVNAGQDALTAKKNALARKYWQLFAESDAAPLFKNCDRSVQKPFFGQVARFAAIFAYQDKDMTKASQLADIAMKDPGEFEQALNLKLEILGAGLNNRQDSINYASQLKELYAKYKTDGVMEKLYNTLIGLGQSIEAVRILDSALAQNPNNFVALADKGIYYLQNDKPKEASEYLKKAFSIKPDNAVIATYTGTAFSVQAQMTNDDRQKKALYKDAIYYLDKAKSLDPNMQQSKWGYNRYNAYYNYYGENAPETKQAEQDSH